MKHRKTLGAWCLGLVLLLLSVPSVASAQEPDSFIAAIFGDNSYDSHYLEAYGHIGAQGPTYIQTEIWGLGSWQECSPNMKNGSWCEDNAHYVFVQWYSTADAYYRDYVPHSCFVALARGFINNTFIGETSDTRCFGTPPDGPGDGYCVSHPWDEGMNYWRCEQSPIIIALGKDKSYRLSRVPVLFDINGDGVKESIYWTREGSEDAFLALDRNGNGRIDDGTELFGDNTLPNVGNGFEALRQLAGGIEAGAVDKDHAGDLFSRLLLWTDRNHDGESQPDELEPASGKLDAVGLGYTDFKRRDGDGNAYRYKGWASLLGTDAPGHSKNERTFSIYDVIFATAK